MAWKKRRRQPMSIFAFLSISCGLIFVFGNLLMLNDGFAQLYETTFRGSDSHVSISDSASNSNPDQNSWHHIELPVQALGMEETKLRRLMQDKTRDVSGTKDAGKQVLKVAAKDLRKSLSRTSDCVKVNNISDQAFIASGWTKAVYKGKYKGENVAVKTIDPSGFDVSNCMQEHGLPREDCYDKAAHKVMKETVLLQGLKHPHIIQVLGHCVPEKETSQQLSSSGSAAPVSMVSELGEPLDLIRLLQMSWEDRLRVCYGIAKLLSYLASSPYGSVVLNDFRRQQFVLVDGELKLTDVDDMGFGEPTCQTAQDCEHYYSSVNFTLRTDCIHGHCLGFNEKKNIFNTARHFTTFLLPHGAPPTLGPAIEQIISAYSNTTHTASQLLEMVEEVVERYTSGAYLERQPYDVRTVYQEFPQSDLPGLFDYRCGFSVVGVGCTVSVFDQQEAEEMCDSDSQCQGFVMSQQHTWTGRTITHLKNNFTRPSWKVNTNLYVKPDHASRSS